MGERLPGLKMEYDVQHNVIYETSEFVLWMNLKIDSIS